MSELKPCPFCGNDNISVIESVVKPFYWCKCEKCGASISCYKTRKKAVEVWNRRSG